MTRNTTIALMSIFVMLTNQSQGQGCSDAGFCTIGNLAAHGKEADAKQKISLQLPIGIGDENVVVVTPSIQYDNRLNNKWSIQGKLTANYANGNLGHALGLGDVFLSGTYSFPVRKNDWRWSVSLGTKLPLSQSNIKADNLSLPMQYQSSLGTIDVITGLALTNAKWQFAAGWQQPLTGTNGNNFLPFYSSNVKALKYSPSNDFNRRGDVLLRGVYKYKLNDRFLFTGGMLGIYHLGEDTYIDGNSSNRPINIKGSGGLTLNATLNSWYKVSQKFSIGLTVAAPMVVRDVRSDGLTRSFVVAPELSWSF